MAVQVLWVCHAGSADLFRDMRPISGFGLTFTIDEESHMFAWGHFDVEHRNLVNGPVMFTYRLNLDGRWLKGAKSGANIVSRDEHYKTQPIEGYARLQPGNHTLQVYGCSASSLAPDTDGLCQLV